MNDVIKALTVSDTGGEHSNIYCPICNGLSKPIGLGKMLDNKIQLVRKCRSCKKLWWYWEDFEGIISRFGE